MNIDLSRLTPAQSRIISQVARALQTPYECDWHSSSDICTSIFARDFGDRLVLYHTVTDAAMTKKAFEHAFASAARTAGKSALIHENPTNPGQDVEVDGVNFSLKTEGSKSASASKITISKFMEARWIRYCENQSDFLEHVLDRVPHHLQKYERIFTLRSFSRNGSVYYELVEIPIDLLARVRNLTVHDFSPRTNNGSSSAEVKSHDGRILFRLTLDGSVEKVTIRGILTSACITHGTWLIPRSTANVMIPE